MSTENLASSTVRTTARDVVVVCPTEYGGQLEHAADLALALDDSPAVRRVTLVSRRGARSYLGWDEQHPVRVVETVPPRRTGTPSSRAAAVARAGLQVLDLLREHVAVRRAAQQAGRDAVVALDSTKYPAPGLLRAHRTQRTVVFVHNAQPHFDLGSASARERVLMWLEHSCARHADRVVTHGAEQGEIVRGYTARPVNAVDLPVSSRLDGDPAGESSHRESPAHEPYALCLGEVRANKGIELAMDAAGHAGVPLLVRGAAESPELGQDLLRRAAQYPSVDFEDRFLSRDEFAAHLREAAVIVLPYTHFDAHSGVLAKAIGTGTPVVASDLASLRAQAGDFPGFVGVDVHDRDAFGAALRAAFDAATSDDAARVAGTRDAGTPDRGAADPHADWWPSVAAVLGTNTATTPRPRRGTGDGAAAHGHRDAADHS
ncbi:glycosyltransferase [Kocuria sp.]|uniref:glycosyltransferase n=1 Tax=Kocuria sp. TaxID=1871328 RepID=UPI0026DBB429|nr:glycosyltransferase [Kocuria sp.]MDO4919644.1 glycosyltransferase [Kocuria sp.]